MPHHEQITIHTFDIQQIIEVIESNQYTGHVNIIDTKYSFTVRDPNGMFLGEVKKQSVPDSFTHKNNFG